MHFEHRQLSQYPRLRKWYVEHKETASSCEKTSQNFILDLCHSLSEDPPRSFDVFSSALTSLLYESQSVSEDFDEIEQLLSNMDFNLNQYLTEMGRVAISVNRTNGYMSLLKRYAEATSNPIFRFFTAWLALNSSDYETCILECELIDHPLASVYTIHGQALLEMGKAREAIDILKIAVKIDQTEIFAWFQLAKAYLVVSDLENAWLALESCEKIEPANPEVALLFSAVALNIKNCDDKTLKAWNHLVRHLHKFGSHLKLVLNALSLAIKLKDKQKAQTVCQEADWAKLMQENEFQRKLPLILKTFSRLRWHDQTVLLIDTINPEGLLKKAE